jgi:hypothetical protein
MLAGAAHNMLWKHNMLLVDYLIERVVCSCADVPSEMVHQQLSAVASDEFLLLAVVYVANTAQRLHKQQNGRSSWVDDQCNAKPCANGSRKTGISSRTTKQQQQQRMVVPPYHQQLLAALNLQSQPDMSGMKPDSALSNVSVLLHLLTAFEIARVCQLQQQLGVGDQQGQAGSSKAEPLELADAQQQQQQLAGMACAGQVQQCAPMSMPEHVVVPLLLCCIELALLPEPSGVSQLEDNSCWHHQLHSS